MYVCVYIYIYIYIYTHAYVYTHISKHLNNEKVPIKHAEEVEEVFDAISYCKGGSVARALTIHIHVILYYNIDDV